LYDVESAISTDTVFCADTLAFLYASKYCMLVCVVTDETRFACSTCQARFKDQSSCRRHEHKHATAKSLSCSICSMQFKRLSQLKHHLQQQHGMQAAADSVLNYSSSTGRLDLPTSSPDLIMLALCRSSAAGQQLQSCNVIVEDAGSSVGLSEAPSASLPSSTPADTDTVIQTAVASSVSEECNSSGLTDSSDTAVPHSLDYLHDSYSSSESALLFSQEHSDSLQLPVTSLVDDSITDVLATSSDRHASLSVVHDSDLPSFIGLT